MSKMKVLFNPKYQPLFKMLIKLLIIFIIITLPLTFNFALSSPPYTISNTNPGGMSYFKTLLEQNQFNTTRTILSTDPIQNLPESSILVISGGTKYYRSSEKLIIDSFVARGGLLVLLANEGPTYELAEYFGVLISASTILETQYYYKSPEILVLESPFYENESLCFMQAKAILQVSQNEQQSELFELRTENTTFIDSNNDKKWNVVHEPLGRLKVGTAFQRGLGAVIVLTSPSFLTNDLYSEGFGNIDLVFDLLRLYSPGANRLVCFEESHKTWPFASTEGIINQSYGTLILLTKTPLFIFVMVLIVLVLFYLTPRFRDIIRSSETYKKFLTDRIWSRKRELYDTFGSPIKPTVEEQYLSNLYFQYELYPKESYSYYLEEKLKFISVDKFTEEERELFENALNKKLDGKIFISLFLMLEEIQKRGKLS
ncbi:MAG: hypothetical protein H7641_00900 [Candidatus Heimdallarchaeota archaeon]|nr:hypothetical protein [Candidatus Heimdallarchaeota archaeon]MCK4876124.1 hypothetical protein [Candidatus Heimdallarchaeota archaeon]